jgi:hypothetical protein
MQKADDAAAWLLSEVSAQGLLYQDTVVHDLEERFGEDAVYINENGNPAISAEVLKAFKKISPNVVWSRSERYWRLREEGDEPGRNQS